jgi:hypothetical protein
MLRATKGILRANSADRGGGLFTASFYIQESWTFRDVRKGGEY